MNFIPLFILRRKRESENEANDYLPLNRAYKVSPTKVYEVPQCTVHGQLVYPSEEGRSDYPRTPQNTPGHPRTHLISYIIHLFIHLFIHSEEIKAKMASNSFHFQVHSFEKVLLNTAENH